MVQAKRVDDGYPPVLDDGEGCIFGRTSRRDVEACREKYRERMKTLERKLDRMTWALVAAAVALAANLLRSVLGG